MFRAIAKQTSPVVTKTTYPFILPSSGSVTVTTGAILLTTPLDLVYSNAYMYFPAGAFTGSTAGFYYVTMSSTTAGTMTSTKYVSGIPTTPTAPVTVTTGAGAYVQDTGTVVGQTFTIGANSMGVDGIIHTEVSGTCLNSVTGKTFSLIFGGTNLGATSSTTTVAVLQQNTIANRNNAALQSYVNNNIITAGANVGNTTVNTALDVTISIGHQIVAVTDYIVSKYVYIEQA